MGDMGYSHGRPLSATENYQNQTASPFTPPSNDSQPTFFPSPPAEVRQNGQNGIGRGHNYQNVRLPLLADPPRPLPNLKPTTASRPYANVEVGKFSSSTSSIPSALHTKPQSTLMNSTSSSQVASQVRFFQSD